MKILTTSKIMLCIMLFLLVNLNANSEDLLSKDKKNNLPKLSNGEGFIYYLTFHPCSMNISDTTNSVSIYVLPQATGKVTLTIYGLNISRTKYLIANTLAEFKLTPAEALTYLREPKDSVSPEHIFEGKGIKIASEVPVSVYGLIRFNGMSEGFNALQESELGKIYQVATDYSTEQPTYASIIGCYDNTKVTIKVGGSGIIVRENGDTVCSSGVIRRTVNEGDVWLIPSINDLSGSLITSTKPCAVITGNYSSGIPDNSKTHNYLIEQELPENIWGTKYYISPVITRKDYSIIKIFAKKPYTQIYADGVPVWTITTPGGKLGSGYIETRAGLENLRPVVISSDSVFPINVIQFNPGDEDKVDFDIPFKMQLIPKEEFKKSAVFATPVINNDSAFRDNYINLVYKATPEGGIPDDMLIAIVKNDQINWIPLKDYSSVQGIAYSAETSDANGRKYFNKTMRLNEKGVYLLKANDPFAVNMYGLSKNGAYGFPVTNNYYDLQLPDTLAPFVEVSMDCSGLATGKVIDEPRKDPENRSNLGLIYMDIIDSYNYTFDVEPYVVGEDPSTNWTLVIQDETQNARAHLVFQDRAGNRLDTIIEHFALNLSIIEYRQNYGVFKIEAPPIEQTHTFTLKNVGDKALDADNYRLYITLDSREIDNKPGDIKVYQNFDLLSIESKDLAPLNPGQEIKFDIRFTARSEGTFRDSVGIIILDKSTGDTCIYQYFTLLEAFVGNPYIIADDYDFKKQDVNTRSNTATLQISNPKTSEYNATTSLKITGYTTTGDKVGVVGYDAIFEVDGLQGISDTNPLFIAPGATYQFKVSFRPDSARHYESRIIFTADSDIPDRISILNGTGEPPSSVNDNVIQNNIVCISPNPARDYIEISSINPMLKHGVDEGYDIQIFDMLGINVSPAGGGIKGGGRIDISNLSPGMYFIKIGNKVEKFVKL